MAGGSTADTVNNSNDGLVAQAMLQGFVGVAATFLMARKIVYTTDALIDFVDKATIELDGSKVNIAKPFPDSLAIPLSLAFQELLPVVDKMVAIGDAEGAIKMVRVIAGGEFLIILDRHPGIAIELYNTCAKQTTAGNESKTA